MELRLFDDTVSPHAEGPPDLVTRLGVESRRRLDLIAGSDRAGFVDSELSSVQSALEAVLEHDLARGPVLCEWGSGLGAVCAVAASLSFKAYGIEIHIELVEAAREMLAAEGLDATFAHGTFVLPGDEHLLAACDQTCNDASVEAYRELDLSPGECDVVFAYPWPDESDAYDRLFTRHATPGALLLTYHEFAGVLVQRRNADGEALQSLGWFGTPQG